MVSGGQPMDSAYISIHSPPNSPPIQAALWHWAEFPVLSSRSLLVLHVTYSALGFLIPLSPPHFLVAVAVFFLVTFTFWKRPPRHTYRLSHMVTCTVILFIPTGPNFGNILAARFIFMQCGQLCILSIFTSLFYFWQFKFFMVADEPFRIMGDLMLCNWTERVEQFLLGSSHHSPCSFCVYQLFCEIVFRF